MYFKNSFSPKRRFLGYGLEVHVGSRYIGAELRSANPNAADVELARDLGYGAIKYLMDGGSGSIITLKVC